MTDAIAALRKFHGTEPPDEASAGRPLSAAEVEHRDGALAVGGRLSNHRDHFTIDCDASNTPIPKSDSPHHRWCWDCATYVPMGAARDTPEVYVEIVLARGLAEIHCMWEPDSPGLDLAVDCHVEYALRMIEQPSMLTDEQSLRGVVTP